MTCNDGQASGRRESRERLRAGIAGRYRPEDAFMWLLGKHSSLTPRLGERLTRYPLSSTVADQHRPQRPPGPWSQSSLHLDLRPAPQAARLADSTARSRLDGGARRFIEDRRPVPARVASKSGGVVLMSADAGTAAVPQASTTSPGTGTLVLWLGAHAPP